MYAMPLELIHQRLQQLNRMPNLNEVFDMMFVFYSVNSKTHYQAIPIPVVFKEVTGDISKFLQACKENLDEVIPGLGTSVADSLNRESLSQLVLCRTNAKLGTDVHLYIGFEDAKVTTVQIHILSKDGNYTKLNDTLTRDLTGQ